MTNKVQKIREEVEKLKEETSIGLSEHENGVEQGRMEIINALSIFLDSLQEESVAPKVLEDMLNAKTAAESLGISQEEHDRIVDKLIYGKEPELVDVDDLPKEKPVSEIDFEKELYKAFGQVKDFTLGMQIAKRFYDMGRNHQEPVSEGLEEAADNALNNVLNTHEIVNIRSCLEMFKAGAQWQRQQMMKDAVDDKIVSVNTRLGQMFIAKSEILNDDKFKWGDKVKLIIV